MPVSKSFGSLVPFSEPSVSRGLPSPYYTPSHEKLRKFLREFVDDELDILGNAYDWSESGQIPKEVYQKCAKEGLVAAFAAGQSVPKGKDAKYWTKMPAGIKPEEWNGFHDLITIEEMHRADFGLGMGLFAGLVIGFPPILAYGNQELKDRVIPEILNGEKRICLAITEPSFGSDTKRISTTAKKSEDGRHYIVNGTKKWITNGIWSDYFTTLVRTSGKPGEYAGISMLLIPRTEGVRTQRMLMGGQSGAGTTYVSFEDVKVPVENLIGVEGNGFKYTMQNYNHERLYIAIGATSITRSVLSDAMAYAHKRELFEGRIIDLGVIRNKLAHMARHLESQQAWIESIVYQLDHLTKEESNKLLGGTTALVKAHSGLTFELVAREAVHILGGIGYTKGGQGDRVERAFREVIAISIPGGAEGVLLDLAVRQQIKIALGLGAKL